jgi:hypothetical protein
MKKFVFILSVILLSIHIVYSQGCIMVRNISGFGQYNLVDNAFSTSDWNLSVTGRYFKAWREFKGSTDQKTPENLESIIRSFTLDMTVSKLMRNGWSMSLSVPIAASSRNSTKDHDTIQRHTTNSFGLGDIRFTVYKWVLKPSVSQKINFQLGLGIKFPTGDYRYQDYFYRKDSTKVLAPVNASIALGDGGTGLITELNTFYIITKKFHFYGNFWYLINPRDMNGVSTMMGDAPASWQTQSGWDTYSVPDVYTARAGFDYNLKTLSFSAGFRLEGVPVNDLLGESDGLRRPGHNLSVEPGIIYKTKSISIYAYVPVIIGREIEQDNSAKKASEILHQFKMGSGSSGNYFVFLGALFKL